MRPAPIGFSLPVPPPVEPPRYLRRWRLFPYEEAWPGRTTTLGFSLAARPLMDALLQMVLDAHVSFNDLVLWHEGWVYVEEGRLARHKESLVPGSLGTLLALKDAPPTQRQNLRKEAAAAIRKESGQAKREDLFRIFENQFQDILGQPRPASLEQYAVRLRELSALLQGLAHHVGQAEWEAWRADVEGPDWDFLPAYLTSLPGYGAGKAVERSLGTASPVQALRRWPEPLRWNMDPSDPGWLEGGPLAEKLLEGGGLRPPLPALAWEGNGGLGGEFEWAPWRRAVRGRWVWLRVLAEVRRTLKDLEEEKEMQALTGDADLLWHLEAEELITVLTRGKLASSLTERAERRREEYRKGREGPNAALQEQDNGSVQSVFPLQIEGWGLNGGVMEGMVTQVVDLEDLSLAKGVVILAVPMVTSMIMAYRRPFAGVIAESGVGSMASKMTAKALGVPVIAGAAGIMRGIQEKKYKSGSRGWEN